MRETICFLSKPFRFTHRCKCVNQLTVIVVTLIRVGVHRARSLSETLAVTLAGVDRF